MKLFQPALGLLFGALAACPALAQEDNAALAMEFSMHDAKFTMYHEIGHMLVAELGLPVLGKEEDAADALATILLLTDENDDDSYNALVDAADGWWYNAVKSTGSGVDELSYYDDHSLDVQRAYAMVCMMVGADPDAFGDTADAYELDAEQQESCAYTYEQAYTSWTSLLEPHAAAEPGAQIEIVYEEAGDYTEFANELQAREVLESAAALVKERYALPGPVTFRAALCDEANAYYYPDESEIVYCYELAAHTYQLYLDDIASYDEEDYAEDEEEGNSIGAVTAVPGGEVK